MLRILGINITKPLTSLFFRRRKTEKKILKDKEA
jgi:hypothetical protein